MDASELDIALEELETRLERLRGLYDQYFLGIEKIEPQIARKDVDRRIWLLRREKIRNTGKRFKFQTLIQRYNTFQQHWQRICREIEAGTYKRHLLRAEKAFGPTELLTAASRRRFRHRTDGGGEGQAASEAPSEARRDASDEAERLLTAVGAALPTAVRPSSEPPLAGVQGSAPTFGTEPASAVARMAAGLPVANAPVRKPLESLDLDLDFGGGSPPRAPARPTAANPARPPAGPSTAKVAPPVPAPKPAAPPAQGPSGGSSLDDARLRDLHSRLIAAKRETNDPTTVSLDRLAKSLKDAETRLRERHANRKIDFDIVIKDGKAIVKPILK